MSARRPLRVTRGQCWYLEDLVACDLRDTPLDLEERAQAKAVLRRVRRLLETWDQDEPPEQFELHEPVGFLLPGTDNPGDPHA